MDKSAYCTIEKRPGRASPYVGWVNVYEGKKLTTKRSAGIMRLTRDSAMEDAINLAKEMQIHDIISAW
jgi:hypothetical protein